MKIHYTFNSTQGKMEKILIVLNGEKKSLEKGITIQEPLDLFKVSPETVVVEVNEDILPRESHATIRLKEGDRVELVRFVGGGRSHG